MRKIVLEYLDENRKRYYYLRDMDSCDLLELPSKYLKHKVFENRSPNTVKRIGYVLIYYLKYLDDCKNTEMDVVEMSYSDQYAHFTEFLYWLKLGNHSKRDHCPDNNTCNAYLETVLGYYQFLYLEYDYISELKVLESRSFSYVSAVGVKHTRNTMVFKGYLPAEKHHGRSIEKDNIVTLMEHCSCLRDQLLLLLLAHTGFRIGELLGIRYLQDIDYIKKSITVQFRPHNPNGARAKNAEHRTISLNDSTFEILEYYLSEHRDLLRNSNYLFINLNGATKGQPMTECGVYSMLSTLRKKTGIKATPHMLRHYFANERRKAGWDIVLISKALGHKHIRTTESYLHIADEELEEATAKFYENSAELYDISSLI